MAVRKTAPAHNSGMTGAQLRAWRARWSYTREELAAETHVSLRTMENYEQGVRQIPMLFKTTLDLILKVRRLSD